MSQRSVEITPNHRLIRNYHQSLKEIRAQKVSHEGALRHAFQVLLADSARLHDWTLLSEVEMHTPSGKTIYLDGTLRDSLTVPRGYWEAKDLDDDLEKEIERKFSRGYPRDNIIFEDTERYILYQNGRLVSTGQLADIQQVAALLNQFYSYTKPNILELQEAIDQFSERVPELANGLAAKIRDAHENNAPFSATFSEFLSLCQVSLNPNIRREAVDEMLIQHLLTERLFRTVFDNQEFTRRNVIAIEVERVIDALMLKSYSRTEYLRSLDPFYVAIERASRDIFDFSAKQEFLNTVYERFFRGYSVKIADTHGIVYTPPVVVAFICDSVRDILKNQFGLALSDPSIHIVDPCTGTGNFIVHLMRRMLKRDLERMYRQQLFANEVMLMPYYIAAMNIEHAHLEITGDYEPFEGLCFVDTLALAEDRQHVMFSEINTARVENERKAEINVIIGNPPYNVGQLNENDNNKNRRYPVVEKRVSNTYGRSSRASNKNALGDAYVKFFRWATDRLGNNDGVICFVSNNGFVDGVAFDGFRKELAKDFKLIYHIDLKGNARTTGERRRQEGGNIFSDLIKVSVGITFLVKHKQLTNDCEVKYYAVPEYSSAQAKQQLLRTFATVDNVPWHTLKPNESNAAWIVPQNVDEFKTFLPLSSIFERHCRGLETTRDEWVYGNQAAELVERMKRFIEFYNSEIDRWVRAGRPKDIDDFVNNDRRVIKWSSSLKQDLRRGIKAVYTEENLRSAMYRPFDKKFIYFDPLLIHRPALWALIFPTHATNRVLVISDIGFRTTRASALCVDVIPDLHLCGSDSHQCFPFCIYEQGEGPETENISDEALARFREHYNDPTLSKWEVFYYVYGILHHDGYHQKYTENLRRELPRIPFAPDFRTFSQAGKELADLHVGYEDQEPWPLSWKENPKEPLSYHVKQMRISRDRTDIEINSSLTLGNIPPEVSRYQPGNRSALDWIAEQYRVTKDQHSEIRSDPNSKDDPEYIVRLVGQVVRVAVETDSIIRNLPQKLV